MNTVMQFYRDVNVIEARWAREIADGQHPCQPGPELFLNEMTGAREPRISWVWLASVENQDKRTTSGMIAKAPIRLGATRAREGVCRLATQDEINAELQRQQENLQVARREDAKLNRERRVEIAPISVPGEQK
jgi:hypothetical protein